MWWRVMGEEGRQGFIQGLCSGVGKIVLLAVECQEVTLVLTTMMISLAGHTYFSPCTKNTEKREEKKYVW